MADRDSPVGVFDSGLGGVSVLRACAALLPNEDFLFFGDSANAPYGEKTPEQVRALTLRRVEELLDQGVKAVVVACNTATSAAISQLRALYPAVPMIGIEPAVKPAAQAGDSSQVLVLATPLTIHEEKYQNLAAAFCHEANVISLPCRGMAELIETGHRDDPVMDAYLQELFLPFRHCGVEYIVLGCTHYPFAEKAIRRNFGRPVEVIDGSEGTARQLRRQLEAAGLLSLRTRPGKLVFENSIPEKAEDSRLLFESEF